MDNVSNVTPIEVWAEQSRGNLVNLPPFGEGQKLVARLKRPSMLALMKGGKIPNNLLNSANTLFKGGTSALNTDNEDVMKELLGILDIICEASFVEPTYAQLKSAGVELTDEQLFFVFNYTQNGVKQLESFR